MPITVKELRDYLASFDEDLPVIAQIDLGADMVPYDGYSQITGQTREYLDDGIWKKSIVIKKGWDCDFGWQVREPHTIRFQTYDFLNNISGGWRFSLGPNKVAMLMHPRYDASDPDLVSLSTGYDPRLLPELLEGGLVTWTPAPDPFCYGSLSLTDKGREWIEQNNGEMEDIPF